MIIIMRETTKQVVSSVWIIQILLCFCQALNNDVGSPQKQTADVSADITGTHQLVSNDRHQQLFTGHRDGDQHVTKDLGNQQSSPDPKMTSEQEPLQPSLDEAMSQSIQQRGEAQALTVATNDKERTMLASRHQQNNADTREGLSHTVYMTHTSLKHDVGAPSIQGVSHGRSQVKTNAESNVDGPEKSTPIEKVAALMNNRNHVTRFYRNEVSKQLQSSHEYGLKVLTRVPSLMGTKREIGKMNTRHLHRKKRQAPGLTYLNYTADGVPRIPVTAASDDECYCTGCNTTTEEYDRGAYENVAYNKPTTASTILNLANGECEATNGIYQRCFHSADYDLLPWLQIDLQRVFTFQNITYIRRHVGGGYYDIRRMLSLDVVLDGQLLYTFPNYSHIDFAERLKLSIHIPTDVVTGRYLRFQKRDEKRDDLFQIIILCSLRIWVCKADTYGRYGAGCKPCPATCAYPCDNHYGCKQVLHNVAILGETSQSIPGIGSSAYPVDGVRPLLSGVNCIRMVGPSTETMVWWLVRLRQLFKVYSFRIIARTDCCGKEYLQNFGVSLLDHRNNFRTGICKSGIAAVDTRQELFQNCTPTQIGARILVWSKGKLGFCEFEAFGHAVYYLPLGSSCSSSSQFLYCDQSTMCHRGTCKRRVFGDCNTDSDCVDTNVCDNGICRRNYTSDCGGNNYCRTGTICDSQSANCRLNYGGNCSGNRQNFCPANAVCDNINRCGIRPGQTCGYDSQCSSGASCHENKCRCKELVSVLQDGFCAPAQGQIGSACQNDDDCNYGICGDQGHCTCPEEYQIYAEDFSCRKIAGTQCSHNDNCSSGLICEGQKCKILDGQDCHGNKQNCKSETRCQDDICRLHIGQNCTGKESLCILGATCYETCKLPVGASCAGYEDDCRDSVCSSADNNTCRVPAGGPLCIVKDMYSDQQCEKGAICVNHVCRFPYGSECETNDECIVGAVCSRSDGNSTLKCLRRLGSSGCEGDNDCAAGSVCDTRGRCSLPKGGQCTGLSGMCLFGGHCEDGTCQCIEEVTFESTENCEQQPGQIGGRCNQSAEVSASACFQTVAICNQDGTCECAAGFEPDHDTLKCRATAGTSCANKTLPGCRAGSECSVGDVCVITVSNPCVGDERGLCVIGSVCDSDGVCRFDIEQNCANRPDDCREGTQCDLLERCKRPPDSHCRENVDCTTGAHCNEEGICECTAGITTLSDSTCVPVSGLAGGECNSGSCEDRNAFCNENSNRCQCQPGFAENPRTLSCAKMAGEECVENAECLHGLKCDPENKTCSIEVGQMCDGAEDSCITGSFCDFDSVCRVNLRGDCTGENDLFCKIGTFCDALGTCNRGVGDHCNSNETEPCVAGADCVGGRCSCDVRFSTVLGATCDPNPGVVGSSCTSHCTTVDSVCVNGRCECSPNFKPDRLFRCVDRGDDHRISRDDDIFFLTLVMSCLLLLLLLILVLIFVRRRLKKKREKAQVAVELRRTSVYGLGLLMKQASELTMAEKVAAANAAAAKADSQAKRRQQLKSALDPASASSVSELSTSGSMSTSSGSSTVEQNVVDQFSEYFSQDAGTESRVDVTEIGSS